MARSNGRDSSKKPRFTVEEAAAAFRLARGNNKKIELIKDEKRRLRASPAGGFVLVDDGDRPVAKRKASRKGASAAPECGEP